MSFKSDLTVHDSCFPKSVCYYCYCKPYARWRVGMEIHLKSICDDQNLKFFCASRGEAMNSQYVQIQNENCQLDGRLGERKTYQQVNQENAAVLYNVDYLVPLLRRLQRCCTERQRLPWTKRFST